jgi:hypothetical protein
VNAPTIPQAIPPLRADVPRRPDSLPTRDRDPLDLQVFFAASDPPRERIAFRAVDRFIDAPQQQG